MARCPIEQRRSSAHKVRRFCEEFPIRDSCGEDGDENSPRPFRFESAAPQGYSTLGGIGDDDTSILYCEREGKVAFRVIVMNDERRITGQCGGELVKIHPEGFPGKASRFKDFSHIGKAYRQVA